MGNCNCCAERDQPQDSRLDHKTRERSGEINQSQIGKDGQEEFKDEEQIGNDIYMDLRKSTIQKSKRPEKRRRK